MNREQVLTQIEPLTKLKVKAIEHTPRTRVVVTPEMVVLRPGGGAHTLEVTPEGARGMVKFAGLPTDLIKQVRPDTFGRVLTDVLEHKRHYMVLLAENRVVDFTKWSTYHQLSGEKVIDSIERSIPGADFANVMTLPDHGITIDVVGEKRQPVAKGDLIQAGASIAFSPIGTIEPLVKSFAMRLACTNGAVANDVIQEFHFGGEGDNIWQWFRHSVKEAYQSIDGIVAAWRNLKEQQIPEGQRAEALEGMLKAARITGDYADTVRAWAIETPPHNEYELINLITRATSHLLEDPRQIVQARDVAADYVSDAAIHQRICPACHRKR